MTKKTPVFSRHKKFRLALVIGVVATILFFDFSCKRLYRAFNPKTHGRVAHKVYHHGYRANFQWIDKYGPLKTPFFSNSLGLRDREVRTVDLKKKGPRILLIGDSYCEGVGIPWEKTFAGLLSKNLAPQGVEVLNAGVMSYTPILERIKIRYLLENQGLMFQRVVLFLDLSDIKDELFYEEDAAGRAREIPYGPFASQAGWGTWVENLGEFVENIIEPNFVIIGALARNLKIEMRKIARKELGKKGAFTSLPDWIQYWETEDPPKKEIAERGVAKLQANLDLLNRYLENRGISLTLVIFPRQEYFMKAGEETRVQKIWRGWSLANGVDYIDLFPAFSTPDSSRYYIPGDGHWDVAGHALVAEILLQNSQKILPRNRK